MPAVQSVDGTPAALSRQPLSYRHGNLFETRDRFADRCRLAIRLNERDPAPCVRADRLDLIPPRGELSIAYSLLMDRHDISSLHDPADHGEDINDQERCRQNE